jgi:TRAP-type C4-dicarboxylate transport system substrate-binding protein
MSTARNAIRIGLALAALATLPPPAQADEVKLLFASVSPGGGTNSGFFNRWAAKVNAAGTGVVAIDVRDGFQLANFVNVYDRVAEDVVQIGWIMPGNIGGKYPMSRVASMPFMSDDVVAASAAMWRLYKSGLLDAEYVDVIPLYYGTVGSSAIHFQKQPKANDDWTGLKVNSSTREGGKLITLMGGAPMSVPASDVYEALNRGTVNAAVMAWAGALPLKVNEVTTFHVEGAFGNAAHMVAMSRKRYAALPEAGRKALDANSGEGPSRDYGAFFKQAEDEGRANATGAGHKVVKLTPEQQAVLEKKVGAPIIEEWVKEVPGRDKVLETYRKIYADVIAGR